MGMVHRLLRADGIRQLAKLIPLRILSLLFWRAVSVCPDLPSTACTCPPHDTAEMALPRGKQSQSWSQVTALIPWVFLFIKCSLYLMSRREGCGCSLMKSYNRTSWGTVLVHWVNGAITAWFLLTEMAGMLLNSPALYQMPLLPLSPVYAAPS